MDIPLRQGQRPIPSRQSANDVGPQSQQRSRTQYVRIQDETANNHESRVRLPNMEGFMACFEHDVAFMERLIDDIYRTQDPQMEQFRMAIRNIKFALLRMKHEWRRFLSFDDVVESDTEAQSLFEALSSQQPEVTGGSSGDEGDVDTESPKSNAQSGSANTEERP
ncbi:hypothetical protein C8A03DRAFT_37271 [Achaetomium macrosporum]|uniref:Uncharacterized protein n=1 Tax=Achaetomium macrosporum TaxID=79813 RepID=A0AAN7C3V7_9PEZI|nr:hypothetical protein C8A03DRAFT_37271 [Achaetomium macrosporum]